MTPVAKLGSLEGRLCGELAATLARRVTGVGPDGNRGSKGAAFYHDSTSAFEATVAVLTKFGLLEPVPRDDRPGETWYCLHALTADADDMPKLLAGAVAEGDERLFDLLVAFLSVFCHYDYLPDRHNPFLVPPHLVASMTMMARAGYAERLGDAFRWAKRVGPAMQAAYLWDENFVSFSETEYRQLDTEALLAWRLIPDTIRNAHFSERPFNRITIVNLLRQCWNGEAWTPPIEKHHITKEFELSERLIRLANGHKL